MQLYDPISFKLKLYGFQKDILKLVLDIQSVTLLPGKLSSIGLIQK